MNIRQMGTVVLGLAAWAVILFAIYKISVGQEVGLNEVIAIGSLLIMYFTTMTWGTKHGQDGIREEEELGRHITAQSSKISYFLLTFCILGAVAADMLIHHTVNPFLLALLGISMILLPMVEFFYAKKYQ